MQPREKKLMEADGMLVNRKYAEALTALKGLMEISETNLQFSPDDFNWQILVLFRMQRVYKSLSGAVPKPLEKLMKYYEIVARNHPGADVSLSREEALICPGTLDALPKVGAGNAVEPADPRVEDDLVQGIFYLLDQNKKKYKLGVFYRKGF